MTTFHLAYQATLDALALRGPTEAAGGWMTTSNPADYLTGDRLRLAQAALELLPPGATPADAPTIAHDIEPRIAAVWLDRPTSC
jgi:hypothetical protein